MTAHAERIREAHRGWRQAEPASRSRIAALETFGLRYERIDDFNVIVEGDYLLNLALSYWRSNDGTSHGYLVSALDAEIRRNRNSEKPAGGRDSAASQLTSGKTSVPAVAESPAGPVSIDVPIERSASLLPVVMP